MNKQKIYLTVLVSVLLAIIIYVSYGMLNAGKMEEYYTVSVILDNSSSDRWNAFKEGLEQGADEHHMHLNVVSIGEMLNIEEECMLIGRELENGADGLIAELCWEDTDGLFAAATVSKPVVLVHNVMQSVNLYTTVAPDQFKLGKAIGEAVIHGESTKAVRIGVLAGNKDRNFQQQRLNGVQEAISSADLSPEWILYEDEAADKKNLLQQLSDYPVDVLVTLDNEQTELAVDFLLEHTDFSLRIYGEGRSEKAVYYLDKGMIETLVVSNEFYMGYRSAELLAQKLGYYVSDTEQDEVEILVVTRENLYEKEMEKILFPTVR